MEELKTIKPEIRIAGFGCGPFSLWQKQKEAIIVGAVFRGGDYLDGLISAKIHIDGLDSTDRLISSINSSKHKGQLRIIMLKGITFGGFNIVDIRRLSEKTGLPVIVVIDHRPNNKKIEAAIRKLEDFEKRHNLIKKAGKIMGIKIEAQGRKKIIYYQNAGIRSEIAEKIIKLTATRSIIPEPLRIADIISKGLKNVYAQEFKK